MKKLALFIFIGLAIAVSVIIPKGDIFDMEDVNSYSFVLPAEKATEGGYQFVQNGNDAIVTFENKAVAKELYNKHSPKCTIFNLEAKNLEKIKKFLKIEQFMTQNLDGNEILYAYTTLYPDFEMLENKKVNVQIVIKGEEMICGFPMVMTGY